MVPPRSQGTEGERGRAYRGPIDTPTAGVRGKVGGLIAHYNLGEWWLATFTSEEREYMEQAFKVVGHEYFTHGDSRSASSSTGATFLNAILSHFPTKKDSSIAGRILRKVEELSLASSDILDLHFAYMNAIKIHYKNRDTNEVALGKAIDYCQRQISIAPQAAVAFLKERADGLPAHTGFKQLAIIREKQGNFEEAIALCEEARRQGWGLGMTAGAEDWDKRIERLRRKAEKGQGKGTKRQTESILENRGIPD